MSLENFNNTPSEMSSRISGYEDTNTDGILVNNSNGRREVVRLGTEELTAEHAKELEESGISRKVAQMLGIRSVSGAELTKYGWQNGITKYTNKVFLLFPYFDPWGNEQTWERSDGEVFPYARIKKPKNLQEGGKYSQPPDSGVHLYIPAQLDRKYGEVLGENSKEELLEFPPQKDIRVTEGEKKTISSYLCTGTLTLGLGGVNSYKAPYLVEYFLTSKSFQICFDNDIWTNHRIAKAVSSLGAWLAEIAQQLATLALVRNAMRKELCKQDEAEKTIENYKSLLSTYPHGEELGRLWRLEPNNLPGRLEALSYTLLPLHPEGKKLGIDDWLIGEKSKDSDLAQTILRAKMPLSMGENCKTRIEDLWLNTDIKRFLCLEGTFGGVKIAWNFKLGCAVEVEKGKKSPYTNLRPIDKAHSRDLCSQLICATAALNSATLSQEIPHVWRGNQVWEPVSGKALSSHLGHIRNSYGFPDGCSGISSLIDSTFNTFNRNELPEYVEYVGLKSYDLDMRTGQLRPIDPAHSVRVRSEFDIETREPLLWLKAATEMLGEEQVKVLRAMLRLSFGVWGETEDFLPVVVGEPGCGKSSLFRAIAGVLPRIVGSNGAVDRLQSNNANTGYFPYSWANTHMVIDYDHKSKRSLEPETLSLINAASENGGRAEFRMMGRDAIELPVTFRLWILANSMPKISSLESGGFKRRLVFLNCQSQQRKGKDQDPLWVKKIVEFEGGQILNWVFSLGVEEARVIIKECREGVEHTGHLEQVTREEHEDLMEWMESLEHSLSRYKNGKTQSEYELNELDELFGLADSEFPEGMDFGSTVPIDSSTGHAHYTKWCRERGYIRRTQKNWLSGLERLGAKIHRDNHFGVQRVRIASVRVRPIGLPLTL